MVLVVPCLIYIIGCGVGGGLGFGFVSGDTHLNSFVCAACLVGDQADTLELFINSFCRNPYIVGNLLAWCT